MNLSTVKNQGRRRWLPVTVLLVGLMVTFLAAYYTDRTLRLAQASHLNLTAQRLEGAINTRLETYIALLQGVAGFLTLETNLSRGGFADYVNSLKISENYPGVQGVGFAIRVAPGAEPELQLWMKQQGHTNFHIWPESNDAERYPIIYLEPMDTRNLAAIGYDMFSHPIRRSAMERARQTGRRAATGKVTLVQEIHKEKQAGFLIYVPVYATGTVPRSEEERTKHLKGFAYCPLRLGDLISNVLEVDSLDDLEIEIYDGQARDPNHIIFSSPRDAGSTPIKRHARRPMQIVDRQWTLFLGTPSPPLNASIPIAVLAGGTLLSIVLFCLTAAEAGARRRAEAAAAQLKNSEAALRDSEARLRLILESALDHAIFSMDLKGNVTSWNNGAERMFGFHEQEILGRSGSAIFTPEDRASGVPEQELKSAFEKGFARDDRWHQRKDGSRLYVSGVVRPMDDEEGRRQGFIKIARDITDRLEAEQRLRAEKEFSETIINSLPGVFYLFDASGRWIRWNRNLEQVTGYNPAEIEGHPPGYFVLETDRLKIEEAIQRTIESGHATVEAALVTRTGQKVPHLFFGQRIVLNETVCVMGMGVDISERKRAEEELNAAQKRLEGYATELELRVTERTLHLRQSLQSLENLLYHVAHDLRAPLRSMASFTKILMEEYVSQLDERACDYARRIAASAHFMDELVQDLLAYGHLSHAELNFSKVSLEREVDAVLHQLNPDILRQKAEVEVVRPLSCVWANPEIVNRIVYNLIDNALKFVAAGKKPHIRIRTEKNSSVRLWVEDNGIGIKPVYHARVFRVFERLHGNNQYSGTGIGLAIVSKGAERLGGRAGLESCPDEGSRFWVELPAA